ncbi:MAG: hypothetical protein R2838_06290 [Caldilineaceae bacterium]
MTGTPGPANSLNVWLRRVDFEHQRRSPDNLAQLIDNTWTFYGHSPKQLRPSARSERCGRGAHPRPHLRLPRARGWLRPRPRSSPARANVGTPPPADPATETPADFLWATLLAEVADRPGRFLVDLTEPSAHSAGRGGCAGNGRDSLPAAPDRAGLERTTILIHGLNEVPFTRLALCDDKGDGNIPASRRAVSSTKCRASRSTDNLILLEAPDVPVLQEPGIAGHRRRAAGGLDRSHRDAPDGGDVRTGGHRGIRVRWMISSSGEVGAGFARNRRAHAMAVRLGDRACSEADVQRVNGIAPGRHPSLPRTVGRGPCPQPGR